MIKDSKLRPAPLRPAYKDLLRDLKSMGYEFRSFSNFEKSSSHVILRHDIDLSLEYAADMAKIEASEDVRSIYFLLVTSPFYNLFEESNIQHIKKILSYRHEIGLHLDVTSSFGLTNLNDIANKQASILKSACSQIDLRAVSFHRPSKLLQGKKYEDIEFNELVNLYDRKYFRDIGYISDSRGGWHYGHPYDHPSVIAKTAIQLLIHPVWWVNGEHDTTAHLITRALDKLADDSQANARDMFSIE